MCLKDEDEIFELIIEAFCYGLDEDEEDDMLADAENWRDR